MTRTFRLALLLLLALALPLGPAPPAAAATYRFKIASLAPEGSIWAKRFDEFAREVEAKSNGEVTFKIYPGGVMGDDRAMYRKMRVGQLQGGGFTMTGIGEVVPDFRVLGVPFLFRTYEEVDRVWQAIWPQFAAAFAEQGMMLLATSEVGFIHTMSTRPITTIDELRHAKCWAPEGDPISIGFLETLGVSPTPLAIPDVLTSLQTGMIDTVFNSYYGAVVLQWFTRTKYITDIPFGYSYGALALDSKSFARLPPAHAALVREAARKHFADLVQDTRRSNEEALAAMKDYGITLVSAAPGALAELRKIREQSVEKLIGSAFSKEIYEAVRAELEAARATGAAP